MSKVYNLDDYRKYKHVQMVCSECLYPWVAVAPEDTEQFECPDCEHMCGEMACSGDMATMTAMLIRMQVAMRPDFKGVDRVAQAIRQAVKSSQTQTTQQKFDA